MIKESNGHTKECNDVQSGELGNAKRYRERWPKYCRWCNATGMHYEAGSYWEPSFEEPCLCLEEGLCPRCGIKALDQEGTVCYSCMWIFGDETALPPYVHECNCWELTSEEQKELDNFWARTCEEEYTF